MQVAEEATAAPIRSSTGGAAHLQYFLCGLVGVDGTNDCYTTNEETNTLGLRLLPVMAVGWLHCIRISLAAVIGTKVYQVQVQHQKCGIFTNGRRQMPAELQAV